MSKLYDKVREMSDQEITNRYEEETLKLKAALQSKEQGTRPQGYPNTSMMNLCRREIERRGLPVPLIRPSEGK